MPTTRSQASSDTMISQDDPDVHGSRTERTGWRPTDTEAAFHSLLTQLAAAMPTNAVEEVPRPEFCGQPHEDPHVFLAEFFEEYLTFRNTTADRRKTAMALSCLKGEAHRRMEPLVHLGLRWEEFQQRLLAYFDNEVTRCRITLAYLGTTQKTGEPANNLSVRSSCWCAG